MSASSTPYPFDTADPTERERLRAQSDLWDPFTFRKLAETGVAAGWRCLELGAGTGSVASWLLKRVGPRGQVVATDVETRWLEPMAGMNLEVRHHDLAADPVEVQGFDLIHARLLVEHLPRRRTVLAKLVAALRPGGWLVVEDQDISTMAIADPPRPAWSTINGAVIEAMQATGSDPLYGRQLLGDLRAMELTDVSAEGFLRPVPVPELAVIYRSALRTLRPPILRAGLVDEADVDDALAAFEPVGEPTTTFTPVLVAGSGRRAIDA
jgi:SAM-dependent methyltransferase